MIIGLGTFILLTNKNTSTPSSTTPAAMKTNGKVINVTLGDSGFVPKDITIKAGTTVIWKNSSGKIATVNSDDHPTHQLYPFLNLGELASGSSVQVVFNKPGRYTYHDHYNATSTGTVTVE